jgi:tRNA G18 (ribose-2'-O)-methylase SpoU
VLTPALFDALDEFGTRAALLIIATPTLSTFDPVLPPAGVALGVAAQDPANLGAILRSALAFGAAQIILLQECAHPFLPKVTRAAAGANFRLALARGPSIKAVTTGFIALDMEGEAIDGFAFPRACRLLLGEEGAGVPGTFKGRRVSIPIAQAANSLNVAVAAGIALAAYRRQHPL